MVKRKNFDHSCIIFPNIRIFYSVFALLNVQYDQDQDTVSMIKSSKTVETLMLRDY